MQRSIQISEKALRRRSAKKQKTIHVRELIATQQNTLNPLGEFYASNTGTVLTTESEQQVIQRMVTQFEDLADLATEQHMQDNFENAKNYIPPRRLEAMAFNRARKKCKGPPTQEAIESEKVVILSQKTKPSLLFAKENSLTRLSTSEFSFYPSREQGPLSLAGFKRLIRLLNKKASHYPINLHFLLATFPVQINKNEVKNIGIYVECGENPVIQPFAKTSTSGADLIYPGTDLPSHVESPSLTLTPATAAVLEIEGITIIQSGLFYSTLAGGGGC